MPRQAVYTLASRAGDFEKKVELVETYEGQTKNELIAHIRDIFPLSEKDKRRSNPADRVIQSLTQLQEQFEGNRVRATQTQKTELQRLLKGLMEATKKL